MQDPEEQSPPAETLIASPARRLLMRALRWGIILITVVALGNHARLAVEEARQLTDGWSISPLWIAAGVILYLCGWIVQSAPWQLSLESFGGPRASWRTL